MTPRPDPAAAYRAANAVLDERPSNATCAAILAAAAGAVDAKPRAAGGAQRRWRIPLAAAATVLISAIAVIVAQRTERELPAPVAAGGAPAPALQKRTDAAGAVAPRAAPDSAEKSAAAPVAPVPTARVRPPAVARSAQPTEAAPARSEAVTESSLGKVAADANAERRDAAGGPQPPVAAAAPKPAARTLDAQGAAERRAEPTAGSAATASGVAATETPERWLARIAELRRAARDDEADAELKKLRERYPQLVIPESARRRAGTR